MQILDLRLLHRRCGFVSWLYRSRLLDHQTFCREDTGLEDRYHLHTRSPLDQDSGPTRLKGHVRLDIPDAYAGLFGAGQNYHRRVRHLQLRAHLIPVHPHHPYLVAAYRLQDHL